MPTKRLCVRSQGDRWCAVVDGLVPKEDASSVAVMCGHFIILPTGTDRRAPNCPDCVAAIKARKTKRKAGTTP